MTTQKMRPLYSITLILMDVVMIALAFWLAYRIRQLVPLPQPLADETATVHYLGLLLVMIASVVVALFFFRQYYLPRSVSRVDQFYAVSLAVSLGVMMAIAVYALLFKEIDYSRAIVVYTWLLAIMLLMIGRFLHHAARSYLRDRGWGKDRLIVVGTGEVARIILQRILWSPHLGYEIVGIVNGPDDIQEVLGIPVLGAPEDLPRLIDERRIDEVIIAMPEKGHRETVRILSYCQRGRVSIKIFPDIFQFVASAATIDDLGGLPLLSVRDIAMRGYMLVFKRLIDVAGALAGLVLLSPLMFLVALAIKLESPGPVFFVQERMGLDGRPFPLIKFRSMRRDAEQGGPGWTRRDDPRQTRLGALLRKVEFDELPNFINVLLGEMSLVGPRPEQPYYVDLFRHQVPHYMERHREKAGMTGWAQVNGLRGDTSIVERTRYDVWYTENWSVGLDLKIILRTIWQIIAGQNARRVR
jgi:exopolysaccharide biosynthesis polyprenyl glycosylphosphotransferase